MVLLVAIVVIFWLAIFFGFHAANGSSFLDYLRGDLEPLPEDLGEWRKLASDEVGLDVEERLLFDEKNPSLLLRQRRRRDPNSGAITVVEPEERIARRRVRN